MSTMPEGDGGGELESLLSTEQVLQIENWTTYHPATDAEVAKYALINQATRRMLVTIMAVTPKSADQSAAIRLVREARMTANAAIACKGK